MVRLVFRPFTHIRRSICTSKSLRASTRVSSGFTLCTQSSPSFGSHPVCSNSVRIDIRRVDAAGLATLAPFTFITHLGFCHPNTRIHVGAALPIFDERFARQYRYDPPPKFLSASTYTGKVHLLSGLIGAPPFPSSSKPEERTELRPAEAR